MIHQNYLKGIIADIHPSVKVGENTFIWSFVVMLEGSKVGSNSVIGSGAYIGRNCRIGNNVRIQDKALLTDGVIVEDDVFIGPSVTTTDSKYPKSGEPCLHLPCYFEEGCSIGAGVVILPGVRIGKNSMIGAGATVTKDVPPNTNFMSKRLEFCLDMRNKYPEWSGIHPSVLIPDWVTIGKNVSIHEGCTIGSQGFGFEKYKGKWLHIPHIGKLIIEDDVEIFEGCNVCRATVNETIIGQGTKIDALCHIGHNSKIGKNCLITAHCIIGGSAVIGDDVYIGLNSTIKDHVSICDRVVIGCGSNVVKDITEENTTWAGNPARKLNGLGI